MTDAHRPSEKPEFDDARDEAVGRLINDFFDRRESGEAISEEEFLARHAEYAEELREHLRGLNLIKGIGSSSAEDPLSVNRTRSIARPKPATDEKDDIHIPEIPGYQIMRAIGRGGMGIVYKATQRSTGRQVALKVLMEGPFAAPHARKRFEREISLSAQLRHANIIPVYDSGRHDGRIYYAMEYVRGLPLNQYIERNNPSVQARLEIFIKIGSALRHAHQRGVIHRDLKPSNILVNSDGEPHLLDFGLAKQGTFSDMTTSLTAQIIGTPAYMSPEQTAGDPSAIDVRTDVYSLGVILFEMLSGKMPYPTNVSIGDLLNNINKADPDEALLTAAGVDAQLSAVVRKALEKSKEQRYQSVDTFVSDIERYLADEPISVRPTSGVYALRRALWKHRSLVAILLFAVGLFGGAGYLLYRVSSTISQKQDQMAMQDQQLKEQAEELRRQSEEVERLRRERERDREQYEALNRMVDPRYRAVVEAVMNLGQGSPRALGEIAESLAKEIPPVLPPTDATASAEPRQIGKDLEAGRQEISLSEPAPDLLTRVPTQAGKPATNPAWVELLRRALLPEGPPDGATSQPSTQPVASIADADEKRDSDGTDDSDDPDPNAADKS